MSSGSSSSMAQWNRSISKNNNNAIASSSKLQTQTPAAHSTQWNMDRTESTDTPENTEATTGATNSWGSYTAYGHTPTSNRLPHTTIQNLRSPSNNNDTDSNFGSFAHVPYNSSVFRPSTAISGHLSFRHSVGGYDPTAGMQRAASNTLNPVQEPVDLRLNAKLMAAFAAPDDERQPYPQYQPMCMDNSSNSEPGYSPEADTLERSETEDLMYPDDPELELPASASFLPPLHAPVLMDGSSEEEAEEHQQLEYLSLFPPLPQRDDGSEPMDLSSPTPPPSFSQPQPPFARHHWRSSPVRPHSVVRGLSVDMEPPTPRPPSPVVLERYRMQASVEMHTLSPESKASYRPMGSAPRKPKSTPKQKQSVVEAVNAAFDTDRVEQQDSSESDSSDEEGQISSPDEPLLKRTIRKQNEGVQKPPTPAPCRIPIGGASSSSRASFRTGPPKRWALRRVIESEESEIERVEDDVAQPSDESSPERPLILSTRAAGERRQIDPSPPPAFSPSYSLPPPDPSPSSPSPAPTPTVTPVAALPTPARPAAKFHHRLTQEVPRGPSSIVLERYGIDPALWDVSIVHQGPELLGRRVVPSLFPVPKRQEREFTAWSIGPELYEEGAVLESRENSTSPPARCFIAAPAPRVPEEPAEEEEEDAPDIEAAPGIEKENSTTEMDIDVEVEKPLLLLDETNGHFEIPSDDVQPVAPLALVLPERDPILHGLDVSSPVEERPARARQMSFNRNTDTFISGADADVPMAHDEDVNPKPGLPFIDEEITITISTPPPCPPSSTGYIDPSLLEPRTPPPPLLTQEEIQKRNLVDYASSEDDEAAAADRRPPSPLRRLPSVFSRRKAMDLDARPKRFRKQSALVLDSGEQARLYDSDGDFAMDGEGEEQSTPLPKPKPKPKPRATKNAVASGSGSGTTKKKTGTGRPKSKPFIEGSTYCHQCRNRTIRPKMKCAGETCTRLWCDRCIGAGYPDEVFDEHNTEYICPFCRKICCCTACCIKRGVVYVPLHGRARGQPKAPQPIPAGDEPSSSTITTRAPRKPTRPAVPGSGASTLDIPVPTEHAYICTVYDSQGAGVIGHAFGDGASAYIRPVDAPPLGPPPLPLAKGKGRKRVREYIGMFQPEWKTSKSRVGVLVVGDGGLPAAAETMGEKGVGVGVGVGLPETEGGLYLGNPPAFSKPWTPILPPSRPPPPALSASSLMSPPSSGTMDGPLSPLSERGGGEGEFAMVVQDEGGVYDDDDGGGGSGKEKVKVNVNVNVPVVVMLARASRKS